MSNQTDNKKKLSFGKIFLWIIVAFIALWILSDGELFEEPSGSNQPATQQTTLAPAASDRKAYLGISAQETEGNVGIYVTSVVAQGPAEQAGVQVGDIITAIGTQSTSDATGLKLAMSMYAPWDTVDVSVIRGSQQLTLRVTLAEMVEEATQPQTQETEAATRPPEKETQPPQTQSTTPPQNSVQVKDPNSSLPKELRKHILVGNRDRGISATFTGDVLITVIFVNDPTSKWTKDKIASTKKGDAVMTAEILKEAKSYGAKLNITMDYRQATVNVTEEADANVWAEKIFASAGLGSKATASATLERTKGVKEAPILFYVNATDRSHAWPNNGSDTEYAVIWNCGSDTVTYRHELFHLFGAADYYMPKAVMECAERYFPNSTMLTDVKPKTDDLTAYLIGWTDKPSKTAMQFLRDTAYVTQEMVSQEYEKNTYTGYVENWERDGDYITGYLDFGILEGKGKIVQANGSWYEGEFEYGELIRGRCKIIYEDGSWYEGDFAKGVCDGQGTMVWADGTNYTGQWKNNQYHGKGKLIYADGSWYEGEFAKGTFNGQGTYVWSDGNSLSGKWKDGEHIG